PCGPASNYTVNTSEGNSIVLGDLPVIPGSQCDDCVVNIPLPFIYALYGIPFSSVNASSNGNLQFASNLSDWNNTCLPYPSFNHTLFPNWDDLDMSPGTCGNDCGIFVGSILKVV